MSCVFDGHRTSASTRACDHRYFARTRGNRSLIAWASASAHVMPRSFKTSNTCKSCLEVAASRVSAVISNLGA
eukprot:6184381-Pleurochrysis_carterae.AAC.2